MVAARRFFRAELAKGAERSLRILGIEDRCAVASWRVILSLRDSAISARMLFSRQARDERNARLTRLEAQGWLLHVASFAQSSPMAQRKAHPLWLRAVASWRETLFFAWLVDLLASHCRGINGTVTIVC